MLVTLSGCTGCWWSFSGWIVRLGLEERGFEIYCVRPEGLCSFSYEATRRTARPDGGTTIEEEGGTSTFYFCPLP